MPAETLLREALNLKYKDILSADWSDCTACVDGTILPAGINWTSGRNDGKSCPAVLLSLNYGIRHIAKRVGYSYKKDYLYLFLDPQTANYTAASQEISNHMKQIQPAGGRFSRNAIWGLTDFLYETNVIVIDDVHRVDNTNGLEYDMKPGEAYLYVSNIDTLIPGFKFTNCIF